MNESCLERFFLTCIDEMLGIFNWPLDVITVFEFNELTIDLRFESLVDAAVSSNRDVSFKDNYFLRCDRYSKSCFYSNSTDLWMFLKTLSISIASISKLLCLDFLIGSVISLEEILIGFEGTIAFFYCEYVLEHFFSFSGEYSKSSYGFSVIIYQVTNISLQLQLL